jgi:phosphatidate cytidylyltransferase
MRSANAGSAGSDPVRRVRFRMNELTKRVLSGALLAALLIGDLWLGEWWYIALLGVGSVLAFREYMRLILRGWRSNGVRLAWTVFGLLYIGAAVYGLWYARQQGFFAALLLFFVVWATDIGAFIFGRAIGGPKIAPSISPSKTWAGLFGAVVSVVAVVFSLVSWQLGLDPTGWGLLFVFYGIAACTLIAVVAQAGDFFESWLKRRAGMKDSGTLIPGHGGLLDRIDGLIPVAAIFPLLGQVSFPT